MKHITPLAATVLALACAVPAAAQTRHHGYGTHASAYVTGGITANGGSVTRLSGAAGVVSLPLRRFAAVPGAAPQVSLEAPLNNNQGRYALTGELVTRGSTFVGLGAGVGRLQANGDSGLLYNVVGGVHLTRSTALVGRFYVGSKDGMGNAGLIGLRVALP